MITTEEMQALARAIQQFDSEPTRPQTAVAYWTEIGRRLGIPYTTARTRATRCGLRPRGFQVARVQGSAPPNWNARPKRG